ncbi:hypothetical protein KFD70_25540 [Bacillus pfraonensis]|uniref:hypothetical protein n=1 Tax=Bacillus TaxID=1386 RepID=UPI002A52C3C0|nr:hypothetical protein [Bacillus pseudomycoides]
MNPRYRFKGWDWTELSESVGIDINTSIHGEDKLAEETLNIFSNELIKNGKLPYEKKKLLRSFIESLINAKGCGYDKPMYEAMLKIEDDHTLISWLSRNLRSMWT